MDEIYLECVSDEWILSRTNESCLKWTNLVWNEWIMSLTTELITQISSRKSAVRDLGDELSLVDKSCL